MEVYNYYKAALASLLIFVSAAFGASPNCPKNGPPSNAQWRLTASIPSGCNGAACSYFVGIRTNEDPLFLDFMMEGNTKGWVAVGFTPNPGMPDADVFACALIGSQVTILDTYNRPNALSNEVDTSQDLCPFNMSFVNGRISCVFSRAIQTNDTLQDKVLNQDYYQLYGSTNTAGSSVSALAPHAEPGPSISSATVNPATSSLAVSSSINPLIKAHGIFMVVAWPVLAVLGIFFAAWMKPALPGAEWFQVHRAVMLASLFFGCVAFILIFVAEKEKDSKGLVSFLDPKNTAHFAIGILVMALQIINPIISALRCQPTHPRRWIFNLIHGTCIGLGVEMLALTNVGIGLALFGNKTSPTTVAPLAVYLAYVAFLLLLIGALFIIFTIIAIKTDSPPLAPSVLKPLLAFFKVSSPVPTSSEVVIDMTKDKSNDPAKSLPAYDPAKSLPANDPAKSAPDGQKKPPSKDAPLRWVGLAAFLVVMVPLMLAVIVQIAVL